jgi:hypothetical protein
MIWPAAGRSGYDEASTSIRHSTQPRTASLPPRQGSGGTGSLPPCLFDGGAVPERDLAEFYTDIADWVLPHLARPLSALISTSRRHLLGFQIASKC